MPPDARDAPPVGWLVYATATMEPPVLKVFLNTRFLPEEKCSPEAAEEGRHQFVEVAAFVNGALEGREFLVANRFSTADVLVGSIAGWAGRLGMIDGHAALQAYAQRLGKRPAYQRATAD